MHSTVEWLLQIKNHVFQKFEKCEGPRFFFFLNPKNLKNLSKGLPALLGLLFRYIAGIAADISSAVGFIKLKPKDCLLLLSPLVLEWDELLFLGPLPEEAEEEE